MLYFDAAATALADEIIVNKALQQALSYSANASSSHSLGKDSRKQIENYRMHIADLLKVSANDCIFTSGATEANHIVLTSLLRSPVRGTILMSKAEHPSVYENHTWLKQLGFNVKEVRVDALGRLDLEDLTRLLTKDVLMVIVMAVNYQSGGVNSISAISTIIRSFSKDNNGRAIHLHVDAAQLTLPWLYKELANWQCDSFALSGHKLGGPMGAGLLYWRKQKQALLQGGGQELMMRSGTENLFAIAGLYFALERVVAYEVSSWQECQQLFYEAVEQAGGELYHQGFGIDEKSPYLHLVRFGRLPAEVIVRHLSEHGIMVGTNSACSGGNQRRLRALLAQGLALEEAGGILRFSYGPWSDISQLVKLKELLPHAMRQLPC